MQETFAEPELPAILQQDRVALLERVAGSLHFKRAIRLREFLLYVGRHSIEDETAVIHEQDVGTAVFGRQRGYDTGLDNIVRVNATELRKRLELYFTTEGTNESLVLEIPRGSYTPVFRPRTVAADTLKPETTEVAQPAEPEKPVGTEISIPAISSGRKNYLPWTVATLLLAACTYLYWQNTRMQSELTPWKSTPALRTFWAQFFDSDQPTDVVVADTSFALAEDFASRKVSLGDYLNYNYKRLMEESDISQDRRADLGYVLERNNGSIGDFIVAKRILGLDPTATTLQLKFAREYSPEEIKTDSVILVGSEQSNPWVELFADRLNFSMQYDTEMHRPFIRNLHPEPGEQEFYNHPSDLPRREGYSIIAFLPDLSRNGNALIIEGTDSQATRSAGEFITNGASLEALRNKLGGGKGFPYFEVLLHNMQITGTPLRSEILAFRNESGITSPADTTHPANR